ncbi:MAG: PhoH family protein [Pseudomonadota bacterium]
MHDPTCLYRFQEHDIFLPMVVLEELDNHKRGHSEVARNVRQASRFLDELVQHALENETASETDFSRGLPLAQGPDHETNGGHPKGYGATGHLFLQTDILKPRTASRLPGNKPDNDILDVALALREQDPARGVTLVSKDINLRIKAHVVGLPAEDYFNDQVLDDVDLLYSGHTALPDDFWERQSNAPTSWREDEGRTFYQVNSPAVAGLHPNQFVYSESDTALQGVVREVDGEECRFELVHDYSHRSVWGIKARNPGQNFALNLLMDPEIDFVSLVGQAGTGKTLLTLAAALAQTLDENRYSEIIITRVTIPVGEDIGFLPGTEEEKMEPWMGALRDNLEVLAGGGQEGGGEGGTWGRQATNDVLMNKISSRSLNFMRGRTFLNKFVILDEAQNLTSKQMKTLITRAGPGTKMVCLGNVAQIDTPYLTETTSGLTYVVDRFKDWEHAGHVTLQRGERSRLADYASEVL